MKRRAPAAARNAAAIGNVLDAELPRRGRILEIASGTGEHAIYFARRFPGIVWQPSDVDPEAIASIAAWRAEGDLANLCVPIHLDVEEPWPDIDSAGVVCINMLHISPASATPALFAGAATVLPRGGPLVLYGPVIEPDIPLADSNRAFDGDLRGRDAAWGLRHRDVIDAAAAAHGWARTARYVMPANNVTLVYRRN